MEKFRMSFPKRMVVIDDGSLFVGGSTGHCFAPDDYKIVYEDKDSILIEFRQPRYCRGIMKDNMWCHWAKALWVCQAFGCLWCETYGTRSVRAVVGLKGK
jgi:hypothetical protein